MAEHTPICNFGWKAPSFSLPGVDGKTYSLDGLKGENGTLVMFICNHCPYVKAVIDRIVRDANATASTPWPSPRMTSMTILKTPSTT